MAPDLPEPRPASRWADLRLRILSAALLVPAGLLCLWWAPWSWALLLAVAAIGMAWEWSALCRVPRWSPAALILTGVMPLLTILALANRRSAVLALLLAAAAAIWLAARSRRGSFTWGVPYLGIPLACLVWLRADPATGAGNLLFLLLVIWCGDIGAYAAGRWLGGPRLAPRISPGKTWSGAAGGLLAAMLAGAATSLALDAWHPFVLLAAAAIAIAGQGGDLLESAIKRRAGVKDSGRSIPGHGGLLDRLDAVLTAAPIAVAFALAAGQGLYLWR